MVALEIKENPITPQYDNNSGTSGNNMPILFIQIYPQKKKKRQMKILLYKIEQQKTNIKKITFFI